MSALSVIYSTGMPLGFFCWCVNNVLYDCIFEHQILHEKVHDVVVEKLKKAYAQLRIGDPLDGECWSWFETERALWLLFKVSVSKKTSLISFFFQSRFQL